MPPEDGSQVGSTVPATNADINAASVDSTAASTVGETVGNKGDSAATTPATTKSLAAYAKGTVTLLGTPAGASISADIATRSARICPKTYVGENRGAAAPNYSQITSATTTDTWGTLTTFWPSTFTTGTFEFWGLSITNTSATDTGLSLKLEKAGVRVATFELYLKAGQNLFLPFSEALSVTFSNQQLTCAISTHSAVSIPFMIVLHVRG